MTNKEIGDFLRFKRVSRGLTQEQVADAIHKSPSAVAMYESGSRRPKDDVAEAYADLFNIPKWSIFYTEDEMIPTQNIPQLPKTSQARNVSGWMDYQPESLRNYLESMVLAMILNSPDHVTPPDMPQPKKG